MRNTILFFLSSLFICGLGMAQAPIQIKTEIQKTVSPFAHATIPFAQLRDNNVAFSGMPTDLDTFKIYATTSHRSYSMFTTYKAGRISAADYFKSERSKTLDTAFFQKNNLKTRIYCLSGLKGGNKVMIVDANNNQDFSDDQVFRFDTSVYFNKEKSWKTEDLPEVTVNYEGYDGKTVKWYQTPINLKPFNPNYNYNGPNRVLDRLLTPYFFFRVRSGQFVLDGKNYYAGIRIEPNGDASYKQEVIICPIEEADKYNSRVETIQGDSIELNGSIYRIKFSPLQMDTITLEPLGKFDWIGTVPGRIFPNFHFKDLLGQDLTLDQFKGKPTLIDFWGSWCGPCIKGIPGLKKLWEAKGDSIQVLSLAFDDNPDAAKRLIEEMGMKWQHVIVPQKTEESQALLRKWKTNAFPTLILLDSRGKVLERASGVDKIEAMQQKILDHAINWR